MSTEATEHTPESTPSLADLLAGKVAPVPATPNLQDEIEKKAASEAEPATPPAPATEPKKDAEPPAPNPEDDPEPTPEEIEAQRIADEEAAAADAAAGADDAEFYTTLDAMYGEDLTSQIDFGDADPMSPEGVFIRETFIRDKAMSEFAESLKENDPRAYSYFLHRSGGGSDDEFFSTKSFVLPSLQDVQASVDLQRDLFKRGSIARGNSEKQTESLLKIAIENGELLAEAETVHTSIQANEARQLAAAEQVDKANKARVSQDIKVIGDAINEVIESNSALKFIIPKNEKEQFSENFRKHVQYENGKFFIVKPLSKENLSQVMEAELFSYLKGDVSKLVQKQATTVAARRTLQRVTAAAKPAVGSTVTPNVGKSLRDILS